MGNQLLNIVIIIIIVFFMTLFPFTVAVFLWNKTHEKKRSVWWMIKTMWTFDIDKVDFD